MPDHPIVRLTASPIELSSPEFQEISAWPFGGIDAFVAELLARDIPQRMLFNQAQLWVYREPAREIVGFGTLELSELYKNWTANRPHPYIPLLAVKPNIQSRGYGSSILRHLLGEAALLVMSDQNCDDRLFLDVFTSSDKAIRMYGKFGFENLTTSPISDPDSAREYFVMAKRVRISGSSLFDGG